MNVSSVVNRVLDDGTYEVYPIPENGPIYLHSEKLREFGDLVTVVDGMIENPSIDIMRSFELAVHHKNGLSAEECGRKLRSAYESFG